MSDPDPSVPARRDPLAALRRLPTVAARCAAVSDAVADGRSGHFKLDLAALPALVARLRTAASDPSPDRAPEVPASARGDRWAALQAGGRDRAAAVLARAADPAAPADAAATAREARLDAAFDLATLLVILDSQAADAWHHDEPPEGAEAAPVDRLALPVEQHASEDLFAMLDRFTPGTTATAAAAPAAGAPAGSGVGPDGSVRWYGSTALAIATARAFAAGVFSSTPSAPAQADAGALRRVEAASLRAALQVTAANRLPGLDARAAALSRLGQRLGEESAREGGLARPARWVREAIDKARDPADPTRLHAPRLAAWLARRLAEATPGGIQVLGLPAGEVVAHVWSGRMAAADDDADDATSADPGTGGWVPFHSMAQSLARTLRPALAEAGLVLEGLDHLPDAGAARHVELLLDTGLLVPRSPSLLARVRPPADEAVVEARAVAITWLPRAAAQALAELAAAGSRGPAAADVLIERASSAVAAADRHRLQVDGESGAW